jgi:Domain of unknown function (DUF4129)
LTEDQALARLQAILARPEYQFDTSVPWWQQLLAPLVDFVWSALARLVALVFDTASGRDGLLGIGILVVSVALVAAALVYLIRALRLSVVRESEMRSASLAVRRERSDQLWQAAQRLAANGEFTDAVRLLYLSSLYALDEHAVLHLERGLTNREHAQRLQLSDPALAQTFSVLVEHYERVRYGHAAVAPDAFAEFTGRAQQVRTAALQGTPA